MVEKVKVNSVLESLTYSKAPLQAHLLVSGCQKLQMMAGQPGCPSVAQHDTKKISQAFTSTLRAVAIDELWCTDNRQFDHQITLRVTKTLFSWGWPLVAT
jgi:hypothetical protein